MYCSCCTCIHTVNECEVDNGGCDHVCTDTVRSYECSCEIGHSLDADDRGCTGNSILAVL